MCCIIPPDILINISKSDKVSPEARKRADRTLGHIKAIREKRVEILSKKVASRKEGAAAAAVPHGLRRTLYDCHQKGGLPFDRDHDGHVDTVRPQGFPKWTGTKLFEEGHAFTGSTEEKSAKNVYDFFKSTYDLYKNEFGTDSIDDNGLDLVGCIHYDEASDPGAGFFNAFWIYDLMAFGDGDREIFANFTEIIDITGHELTHGVTEYTAQLEYANQAGALNESISDVFGSMVKQYAKEPKQPAREADWLIGRGLFLFSDARALRDMANPGTAHGNTRITGPDRQPRDMDGYVEKYPPNDDNDWGGVHLYSGIPNRAFFLVATTLGGYSWDKAGKIWYNTLTDERLRDVNTRTAFKTFADLTVEHAANFGNEAVTAVKDAWTAVKVYPWNQHWMPTGGRNGAAEDKNELK